MKMINVLALVLAPLTLTACGAHTGEVVFHSSGGGGDDNSRQSGGSRETPQESKERSGETNPGETNNSQPSDSGGSSGSDDSDNDNDDNDNDSPEAGEVGGNGVSDSGEDVGFGAISG